MRALGRLSRSASTTNRFPRLTAGSSRQERQPESGDSPLPPMSLAMITSGAASITDSIDTVAVSPGRLPNTLRPPQRRRPWPRKCRSVTVK
jgi:hypothetical protein